MSKKAQCQAWGMSMLLFLKTCIMMCSNKHVESPDCRIFQLFHHIPADRDSDASYGAIKEDLSKINLPGKSIISIISLILPGTAA